MPDPAPNDSAAHSPFELTPLAQLGAVTGRFVHDLANDISSAATLMTLISEPDSGNAPAKEDLEELNAALERAVTLIHHFGATVRTLRPPPEHISFSILRPKIEAFIATIPSITLNIESSPEPDTAIICHPDWLIHCIHYLATLADHRPTQACVAQVSAKDVKPPADYYSIDKATHYLKISLLSSEPYPITTTNTSENLPLFVTRELLRHMRGFLLGLEKGSSKVEIHLPCAPASAETP